MKWLRYSVVVLLAAILAAGVAVVPAAARQSLFVMIPHTEGQAEYTWFTGVLNRFKAKYPDVDVRFEPVVGTAIAAKLTAYLASGESPDVVMMMQRDLGTMINTDMLYDLNQFLAVDTDIKARDYVGAGLLDWSRQGKLLAMPINPDTGIVFYDTDMFDAAGLPLLRTTYPSGQWTWDDLRRIAQRLTKDANGDKIPEIYGFFGSWVWEPLWAAWVYTNGGNIFDAATKKSGLDRPEAYQALQWLADLKRDGIMFPKTTSAVFKDRAMMVSSVGQATVLANAGVTTAVFPLPAAAPGKIATHTILGPGLLLFKSSKNPALGWALIKEAMNHEGMVSLAQVTSRLPSRLSAFQTWQRIYEQKTADAQYVLAAVESGRGLPYNSKWNEMNTAIRKGLDQLFANTRPAADIFTGVARSLEALYQD